MRALVQRVSRAAVRVKAGGAASELEVAAHGGQASIGHGLAILVGVGLGDGEDAAVRLARKIVALRIFADDQGRMNRSVLDVGGALLVVSQFTLFADVRKGNRPSFGDAAAPDLAKSILDAFVAALRGLGMRVETGVFGADMDVELVNDGPVTVWLDSAHLGELRALPFSTRSTR